VKGLSCPEERRENNPGGPEEKRADWFALLMSPRGKMSLAACSETIAHLHLNPRVVKPAIPGFSRPPFDRHLQNLRPIEYRRNVLRRVLRSAIRLRSTPETSARHPSLRSHAQKRRLFVLHFDRDTAPGLSGVEPGVAGRMQTTKVTEVPPTFESRLCALSHLPFSCTGEKDR